MAPLTSILAQGAAQPARLPGKLQKKTAVVSLAAEAKQINASISCRPQYHVGVFEAAGSFYQASGIQGQAIVTNSYNPAVALGKSKLEGIGQPFSKRMARLLPAFDCEQRQTGSPGLPLSMVIEFLKNSFIDAPPSSRQWFGKGFLRFIAEEQQQGDILSWRIHCKHMDRIIETYPASEVEP